MEFWGTISGYLLSMLYRKWRLTGSYQWHIGPDVTIFPCKLYWPDGAEAFCEIYERRCLEMSHKDPEPANGFKLWSDENHNIYMNKEIAKHPVILTTPYRSSKEPTQQHLLPWLAVESTLGPTLMLDLGGSILAVDDSRDLLDTIR